jgi:2-polyprenyl-3-methyl-5-hydroxy-6-metoxy-1,4-benzoquinol methylase
LITNDKKFLTGDIYNLPLSDNAYDLVICTEVLEHLIKPNEAIAELVRIGCNYYLLSVPFEPFWRIANIVRGKYLLNLGNTPTHVNHWTRYGFRRFIDRYLEVIDIRNPFPWTIILAKV